VTDPLVQYQMAVFVVQTIILIAQLVVFLLQYLAFRDQARTLQATVRVANEQFKAMQQENNKNAFFALLPEVTKLAGVLPDLGTDTAIENAFKQRSASEREEDNDKFLLWCSTLLKGITVNDHFRRSSLFRALARLYDDGDTANKQLFRDALCSTIGDEMARLLILQAICERDEGMLINFGKFPMAFENLHRMPALMEELLERFAKPFKEDIMKRAKNYVTPH
jgi:hypothetical protein